MTARATYGLSRWIFLRFLGAVYLVAFGSLAVQVLGLIGSQGISPAKQFLADVSAQVGWSRFILHPTLLWLDSSDPFLLSLCWSGVVFSSLLIAGFAPRLILALLWAFYLSLTTVSPDFMGHPWEGLLLETGFLAMFFAPAALAPRRPSINEKTSKVFLLLLLWLLFRLTFSSSVLRMLSGDPRWRDLISLAYHYETQPLPTYLGWYVHQLPLWFHKACLAGMFAIEPLAPFFIFLWRDMRVKSFIAFVVLQILVLVSGNYSFFSLLTLALCVLLLDDQTLLKYLPGKTWKKWVQAHRKPDRHAPGIKQRFAIGVLVALLVSMSGFRMIRLITGTDPTPAPLASLFKTVDSFKLVNHYGLFTLAPEARKEIIIEGSNDQKNWIAYEFRYKPGPLNEPPHFVAPHQPRLDWQMWSAALSTYEVTPWFQRLMQRLAEGSPDVLKLLRRPPFAAPPRYLRARLYRYRFTDLATQRRTGEWWHREYIGEYAPLALRTIASSPAVR